MMNIKELSRLIQCGSLLVLLLIFTRNLCLIFSFNFLLFIDLSNASFEMLTLSLASNEILIYLSLLSFQSLPLYLKKFSDFLSNLCKGCFMNLLFLWKCLIKIFHLFSHKIFFPIAFNVDFNDLVLQYNLLFFSNIIFLLKAKIHFQLFSFLINGLNFVADLLKIIYCIHQIFILILLSFDFFFPFLFK